MKKGDADKTERSKEYSTYYQYVVQNQELVGVRTATKSRGTLCVESWLTSQQQQSFLLFLCALQNLCTLISAASKLTQLQCLWQTKDSGQVSALTWSMSAYTCASKPWRAHHLKPYLLLIPSVGLWSTTVDKNLASCSFT